MPAPLLFAEVVCWGGLDQRVRQHLLERAASDASGGERSLQRMRGIAAHGLHPGSLERGAIERPPGTRLFVARADPLLTKTLLAAGKEPQIIAHSVPIMGDEALQPTVMIAVSVAQNEPVEPFGLDAEQTEIA